MTPSNTSSADARAEFSPAPLLDAFENFQGSFFDLDRQRNISAGELKTLKNQLCVRMTRLGLRPGDRIVTAVPNGPLFAAVWAASLEYGASPILVHDATPPPELNRVAESWGARFTIAPTMQPGSVCLIDGHYGDLQWQEVSRVSPASRTHLVSVPLHPTSGTSGAPKIALRPGPCAVAEPLHYIQTLSITSADTILCTIPMSHAYAYGMCFMAALLTSAKLVFARRFNPPMVRDALSQGHITIFPAVPATLDALLEAGSASPDARPRIVLSAGAPLQKKTFDVFRERWRIAIRPLYGTTETGGITIADAEIEFDDSVGPPMQGVEVDLQNLRGWEGKEHAKVLQVRSSSMMAGYLDEPQPSGLQKDGWFETGDLASIDDHGRIHLQGRLSEIINVLGLKVLPREVEEVIAQLPEVAEVKVYGRHWRGQEVVEAAVVCRGQLTEDQILMHCDQYLVSYKCPIAIRFLDVLPRTASGKIAVERLVAML